MALNETLTQLGSLLSKMVLDICKVSRGNKSAAQRVRVSTIDLENGSGGVEAHARHLARELRKKGVTVEFSQDPQDLLKSNFDVIHLHGSSCQIKNLLFKRSNRGVRLFTLHGSSWERMIACSEYLSPTIHRAALRELSALLWADVVAAVNPNISFLNLAKNEINCWP